MSRIPTFIYSENSVQYTPEEVRIGLIEEEKNINSVSKAAERGVVNAAHRAAGTVDHLQFPPLHTFTQSALSHRLGKILGKHKICSPPVF
jgi:hypothetical protein